VVGAGAWALDNVIGRRNSATRLQAA